MTVRVALLAVSIFAANAHAQDRHARLVVAPAETLQVSMWGDGEPVVIVPGIWSSTYAFRKVVPRLRAEGVSVMVIEPLGVASSSRPRSANYSMTAQSRRIAAALDSLGIRDAIFVGQALSASMLLRLAIESPVRIRGMISLEGGATDESATPGLRRGLAIAAFVFRIFPSQALMRQRVRSNLENVSSDKSWINSETVDGYMAPWRRSISETIQAYRAMASSREEIRLDTRLARVRMPISVLLGAAPHYGGVQAVELAPLQNLVPQVSITRVPGAGHLLHEERPDDVVRAILRMRESTPRVN